MDRGATSKVKKTCEVCGDTFYLYPSEIEEGKGKYCSRECQNEGMKNRETYTCPNCGEEFKAIISERKYNNKYCSRECYLEDAKDRVKTECDNCGKEIIKRRTQFERTENHFCSDLCKYEYRSDDRSIDNYFYSTKWWHKRRREVLERDNYECQVCGLTNQESKDKTDFELDIHHKEPLKNFEDKKEGSKISNLITLCRKCHRKIEVENK